MAKFKLRLSTSEWILLISAGACIAVAMLYFLFFETSLICVSYLAVIAISIMLFPYSFYEYYTNSKIKEMEEQFPLFLKDLADNLKAGLSISDAVRSVSRNDYKALNTEIRKLSNQMSWGVSFEKSIGDVVARLKKSVFISKGLTILVQAFKSGGDITTIMNSIADSTVLLQNVQKDQENQMLQQVSIIYMIQLVFVGIIIILFKVLVPITNSGAFSMDAFSGAIGGGSASSGFGSEYYKGFFFLTLCVQSVCNGFVAGYTKDNSLVAGVRHVAIMLGFSILLFTIFILPETLSITAASDAYSVMKGERFRVAGVVKSDDSPVQGQSVEVLFNNATFSGITSESGEYYIEVLGPNERGTYEGIARIEYDNSKAETVFSITVR